MYIQPPPHPGTAWSPLSIHSVNRPSLPMSAPHHHVPGESLHISPRLYLHCLLSLTAYLFYRHVPFLKNNYISQAILAHNVGDSENYVNLLQ